MGENRPTLLFNSKRPLGVRTMREGGRKGYSEGNKIRRWYFPPSNSVPSGPRIVQCHSKMSSWSSGSSQHGYKRARIHIAYLERRSRVVWRRIIRQFSGFLHDTLHSCDPERSINAGYRIQIKRCIPELFLLSAVEAMIKTEKCGSIS